MESEDSQDRANCSQESQVEVEEQLDDEEEIEEEDLIDIWIVRNNNSDENAAFSQLEILTYENKLNCTNRKSINVSNCKIESVCHVAKLNQIWLIDSNKSIFIYW